MSKLQLPLKMKGLEMQRYTDLVFQPALKSRDKPKSPHRLKGSDKGYGHLHCLQIMSDNPSGQAGLAGLPIDLSEGDLTF